MAPARRTLGFSLIETLIALVIVAVLACLTYPSYAAQLAKGRRAEALVALYQLQQAQERWRVNHPSYASRIEDLGLAPDLAVGYRLAIAVGSVHGYTLVATAVPPQADPACTTLSLGVDGEQLFQRSTGSGSTRSCWSR